jgi:hypothetical protein
MTRHRKRRGGYSSASDYVLKTFGTADQQYDNALKVQPGQNLAAQQSNSLNTLSDPNSSQSPIIVGPQLKSGGRHRKRRHKNASQSISKSLSNGFANFYKTMGGRRKRRRTRRKRKGGFLGSAITQAAVPFTLLGLRQSYKKRYDSRRR